MGGDLSVSSEKGQGSVFSIILPVKVRPAYVPSVNVDDGLDFYDAREQRLGASANQDLERRQYISTILFVNEEPMLARQFARYFELKGFSTKTASNADETMSVISQLHCDVIIMDLELAGAKDWRLMKYIQGYPEMQNSKIVLLGDRAAAEQGLALGAIDCLPVPTDKSALHVTINSCVRNSRGRSQKMA